MRGFMDAIPDILLAVNSTRQIVFANKTALDFFRASDVSELWGRRPGEVAGCIHSAESQGGCGDADACKVCGAFRAIMQGLQGDTPIEECRMTLAGGHPLDLRVWARPFDLGGGTVRVFVHPRHQRRKAPTGAREDFPARPPQHGRRVAVHRPDHGVFGPRGARRLAQAHDEPFRAARGRNPRAARNPRGRARGTPGRAATREQPRRGGGRGRGLPQTSGVRREKRIHGAGMRRGRNSLRPDPAAAGAGQPREKRARGQRGRHGGVRGVPPHRRRPRGVFRPQRRRDPARGAAADFQPTVQHQGQRTRPWHLQRQAAHRALPAREGEVRVGAAAPATAAWSFSSTTPA